ncbi:hypothetical protein SPRG_18308, partial [Saprolegnia parasitica CBS 223.65]
MVKFGKKLLLNVNPEWEGQYLEYRQLKKDLKKLTLRSKDPNDPLFSPKFEKKLDAEIEKIVLFFLTKQGEFAQRLATYRQAQQSLQYASEAQTIASLADGYRKIGEELVHLLHYVELNATGLRKILKKHDKNNKAHKITDNYISTRVDANVSHLQQLYHDEGISAIIATIRVALKDLQSLQADLGLLPSPLAAPTPSYKSSSTTLVKMERSISETEPILNKISVARQRFVSLFH